MEQFPAMQKFQLSINYRNSREIAEYYVDLLSDVLPAKPTTEVSVYETGEVIKRGIRSIELDDILGGLLRRLLSTHVPEDIGVVSMLGNPTRIFTTLAKRGFPVTEEVSVKTACIVTNASKIRGHERSVVIAIVPSVDRLRRNHGVAIDAYIGMSRAKRQLLVLEIG